MEPETLNPLVLAYLGDAVYELEVRRYLVAQGIHKVKDLHSSAVGMVKATTQAKVIHQLLPSLNEQEVAVVKRGRNAKSGSAPKNTDVIDYRYATALESLIGFWYLKGSYGRIKEMFELILQCLNDNEI